MNKGSIILLFMLSVNLVGFGIGFSCAEAGSSCGSNFDNSVINFFFNIDGTTDLNSVDGLSVDENYRASIEGSLTQETGVATATALGAIGFLDVVKMTIAFLSLVTPLPFLVVLYSFGIPLLYMMLLSVILFVFYTLAIVEIIRGVQF